MLTYLSLNQTLKNMKLDERLPILGRTEDSLSRRYSNKKSFREIARNFHLIEKAILSSNGLFIYIVS
jgi:hypothetical protein